MTINSRTGLVESPGSDESLRLYHKGCGLFLGFHRLPEFHLNSFPISMVHFYRGVSADSVRQSIFAPVSAGIMYTTVLIAVCQRPGY